MYPSASTIRALDESVRPFLAEGRAGYHALLSTSTFFVAFGVLLEVAETFKDAHKELGEYSARRKHSLSLDTFGLPVVRPESHRFPWIAVISILGWFMVAFGVAGEFRFDDKVSGFDATLQRIDNELLAQTNLDASGANERAGIAIERATHLTVDLEQERQTTARFQVEATEAERSLVREQQKMVGDLDATNKFAADSAKQLEAEKKKRLDLAASLLPRDFFDQSGALGILSRFMPMSVIFEFASERESRRLAEEINFVFAELDWDSARRITEEDMITDGITISIGVKFSLPPASVAFTPSYAEARGKAAIAEQQASIARAREVAIALRDLMRGMHIDAKIGADINDLSPQILLVAIGPKPNPAFDLAVKELGLNTQPTTLGVGVVLDHNLAPIANEHPQ